MGYLSRQASIPSHEKVCLLGHLVCVPVGRLCHMNLVLQDGGIISTSSSGEEDDPQSIPAPKRLKSMAIRPPPMQTAKEVNPELPSSTCKNLTVKEGMKSLHSAQDTTPQVLPKSESPIFSPHHTEL